jgi:hypothetical protein
VSGFHDDVDEHSRCTRQTTDSALYPAVGVTCVCAGREHIVECRAL